MGLSGILIVQAICVFSCCEHTSELNPENFYGSMFALSSKLQLSSFHVVALQRTTRNFF